jgi:hypothetical protein
MKAKLECGNSVIIRLDDVAYFESCGDNLITARLHNKMDLTICGGLSELFYELAKIEHGMEDGQFAQACVH